MRVLVTGARGQVGSELILEGERLGIQMLATGREELDITLQDSVDRFFQEERPDIVVNAAAYTAVDQAETEPELAYSINRNGAANLARACADTNTPLLHISTDYVFDGSKKEAYVETDITNPQCIYGKSKLDAECAIESVLTQYIILRVSWVFGIKGKNFVKTMLRLGKERNTLKIVSDQRGGPTPAVGIAKTLLILVKCWRDGETIPWGTYHYCGQPATTWQGFAEAVFEQAEIQGMIDKRPRVEPIMTSDYPTQALRPLNSVLDCQKIMRELGVPQPNWHSGLRNMLSGWEQ